MIKRILLINPPSGSYIRDDRCQVPTKGLTSSIRMPLDLAYMAAVLEELKMICKIQDYPAIKKDWQSLKKDLQEFFPDILIVSTTTPTLLDDLKACQLAKEFNKNILTIVKGAHFAVEAKEIMQKFESIDIAIRYEYEMAIREIALGKELRDILGITYREKGLIVLNEDRPFLENLDKLPYPARHLLNNNLYIRPDTSEMQTSILASRGCPNNCFFCLVKTVSGKKINKRSPQSIVEEMKFCLKNFKIKNFYLRADTFTHDKKWVIEICQRIIEAQLDIKWVCNSRVDTLDEEMIQWLKKANCWMISFGIESGDQEILDKIKKRITISQIKETINLCKKYKIKTYLFFVYGLPWETKESLKKTFLLAKGLAGDFVEFHQAYPFPGTDFYNQALKLGLFKKNEIFNSDVFSSPVASFCLSKKDINKFRKKSVLRYYFRKKFILEKLKEIDSFKKLINYTKKGLALIFDL